MVKFSDKVGATKADNVFEGNKRFNGKLGKIPIRTGTIIVGASPFTYTNNDRVPQFVHMRGGGVSEVRKNGVVIFTSSSCDIWLEPNEAIVVEYSGTTPVMMEDRK